MSQGADIRNVRVINGEEQLRINVVHRDLVRSFRSGSSISVFIDTDRTRTGPEFVFTGGTFEGADYALLKADGFKAAGNRQVPLNGGTYIMKLDYARDVARISIDQVVLERPGRGAGRGQDRRRAAARGQHRDDQRGGLAQAAAPLHHLGGAGLNRVAPARPGPTVRARARTGGRLSAGPWAARLAVSRARGADPMASVLNPYISFDGTPGKPWSSTRASSVAP